MERLEPALKSHGDNLESVHELPVVLKAVKSEVVRQVVIEVSETADQTNTSERFPSCSLGIS